MTHPCSISLTLSCVPSQLIFFSPAIAAKQCLWLPLNALQKPQRMWLVGTVHLSGNMFSS